MSPFPAVSDLGERSPRKDQRSFDFPGLRKPASVAVLALALALVSLVASISYWRQISSAETKSAEDYLREIQTHISQGEALLTEGNFQLAAEEFTAARAMDAEKPNLLNAAEAKNLTNLLRQAALLADLSSESLEELGRQMAGLGDKEAQILFARRFRGRAVVFYSEVRRDATGQCHIDYRIGNPKHESNLNIGGLTLLQRLPLTDPRLLLFGARLAEMRRKPDGSWVIGFEPDSGVLITHPGAAASCCFDAMSDQRLSEVLQSQTAWAAEIP
jgi:hypothetical protein